MEQVRIFMPMFGLWQTYTALLNTIGRIVITGRMLSPLAFFFITVFSTTEHRQEFTQNIIMALLISVFTGLLMPLDASNTTSTCTVVWSYKGFFLAVRIFMFIATTVCFIYNAKQHGWRDVKQSLTGYLFLISGYVLLCNADCMALLSSGALFLAIGTWQFIASYHKQYLWR